MNSCLIEHRVKAHKDFGDQDKERGNDSLVGAVQERADSVARIAATDLRAPRLDIGIGADDLKVLEPLMQ